MNEQILELIKTVDEVNFSLAYELFPLILASNNPAKSFQSICEEIELIESDKSKKLDTLLSEDELQDLGKKYDKIIDEIIEGLIVRGLDENTFYEELWKSITSTPTLPESETYAQAFALFRILYDERIPYFNIPKPGSLTEEEFSECAIKLHKEIQKLRFIVRGSNYSNNVELCFSLIDYLDSFSDKKEKVMLLSFLIFLISTSSEK